MQAGSQWSPSEHEWGAREMATDNRSIAPSPVLLVHAKGSGGCRSPCLPAQAETRDERSISLDVVACEVVEQATPLAHQHQKAPP